MTTTVLENVLYKEYRDVTVPYDWWHGPIPKREPPDFSLILELERMFATVSALEARIQGVETHLTNPAAGVFVRAAERPAVGSDLLQKVTQTMELLGSRLQQLEQRLVDKKG